jgi:hypothetical protein
MRALGKATDCTHVPAPGWDGVCGVVGVQSASFSPTVFCGCCEIGSAPESLPDTEVGLIAANGEGSRGGRGSLSPQALAPWSESQTAARGRPFACTDVRPIRKRVPSQFDRTAGLQKATNEITEPQNDLPPTGTSGIPKTLVHPARWCSRRATMEYAVVVSRHGRDPDRHCV